MSRSTENLASTPVTAFFVGGMMQSGTASLFASAADCVRQALVPNLQHSWDPRTFHKPREERGWRVPVHVFRRVRELDHRVLIAARLSRVALRYVL
jgi:hypothetical protein